MVNMLLEIQLGVNFFYAKQLVIMDDRGRIWPEREILVIIS